MNARTVGVGVLALVFGVATAFGVKTYLDLQANRPPEVVVEKAKTTSVVVAKLQIPHGKTVVEADVETKEWPADLVPDGAMDNIEKVIKRAALATIIKGEPILDEKLAAGPRQDLASHLAPGMRAFTIHCPTAGSGVAGFILPGNKVDVLLTVSDLPSLKETGPMTVTLMQGIEILAVDQQLEAPVANKMDPKELHSVTLAVTATQAAKLALGGSKGTLNLALRNPADEQGAATEVVTLADLQFLPETPPTVAEKPVLPTAVSLASQLAIGMRAYTIKATLSSGVAGLILPKDKVDVLLTAEDKSTKSNEESKSVTVTLLQGVEVLAIDQLLEAPVANKTEPKQQYVVTLAVTPVQAAQLALAETKGMLSLSLRSANDANEVVTVPVTVADLKLPERSPPTTETKPEVAPPAPVVLHIRTLRGSQNGLTSVYPLHEPERSVAATPR